MRKITILLFLAPIYGHAQSGKELKTDTLPAKMLQEITVYAVQTEGDSLQNFYRANKSASTEDILSRMQGVSLIRRGGYGQEPLLRSMSGGQINVTLDGMKMFGACTDKMDPATIYVEPQNLVSINTSLGPNGSSLGSTVGGSLNMKLAEPHLGENRLTGKAGTGYQHVSHGFNTYLSVNKSLTRSAYRVNLIYRKNKNYKAGGGETVPYSQYEKLNFSVGGKWRIRNDTLRADILLDDGWNIGFPALPMDVGYAKARIYALTYQRFRPGRWMEDLRAKVYANQIIHIMDDSHRQDVVMHMDMPGSSETYGTYAEGTLKLPGKHKLSFRADFFHNAVLAEMTMYPADGPSMYMQTWPASGRNAAGLYVSDKIKLNGFKIDLNARLDATSTYLQDGIGKDQLEVFYPDVNNSIPQFLNSYNATVQRQIAGALYLNAHMGYGERQATISELYGFYLFNRYDGYDYLGNPDLKKERSTALDFTLQYVTAKTEFQLTGFYQYFSDYIFSVIQPDLSVMTPGANGVKIYENIRSASLKGIEANFMLAITRNLQFMNTLKYTYGRTCDQEYLPLIPPLKSVTSLRFLWKDFNIQGEWEGALQQSNINIAFGENVTPSYNIANLRLGYTHRIEKTKVSASAGLENIFDLYYHEHLDWGDVPRPGRNLYATLEVSF